MYRWWEGEEELEVGCMYVREGKGSSGEKRRIDGWNRVGKMM